MYFLVTLRARPDGAGAPEDHEQFVDSLIARNVILLGGRFSTPLDRDVSLAYVLRCDSQQAAEAIVNADPLVRSGRADPTITNWILVAINTAAIDDGLVVTPGHPEVQDTPDAG
jgi:uncharacterized protein YciI